MTALASLTNVLGLPEPAEKSIFGLISRIESGLPVRTLDRLDVTRQGDLIEIRATAQSFLHNQIRSFAGTLKLAGDGKMTPDDVQAALEARDRKYCGPVAPPEGLYFLQVDYKTDQ